MAQALAAAALSAGLDGSSVGVAAAGLRDTALRLLLLLPRPYAMFMVAPFLSKAMLPGAIRHGFVLMIAAFALPLAPDPGTLDLPGLAALLFKESVVGVMLGLNLGVFVWAVQSVGDFVDVHTGASNASFFDPTSNRSGGPTGQFLGWLVMALFMGAGGLGLSLGLLFDSWRVWPQSSMLPELGRVLAVFALHEGDSLFSWIARLGAPVLTILMLVDVGLGLIGRFVPQLNIFLVSQPLKSLVALFMFLISLGLIYDSLQDAMRPDASVLQLLKPSR